MSAGETKPAPPKAPPRSREHSGEGSVGPSSRDSHRALGEGARELPPSLSATHFLNEALFGGDAGDKSRRQAWSHRAELLMQSMNPCLPWQAAVEANENGSLCAGQLVPRLLLALPASAPTSEPQKSRVHLKALSPRAGREGEMRAGGRAGDLERFAGLGCVWRSFAPALSGAGCARGGGASCAPGLRSAPRGRRAGLQPGAGGGSAHPKRPPARPNSHPGTRLFFFLFFPPFFFSFFFFLFFPFLFFFFF